MKPLFLYIILLSFGCNSADQHTQQITKRHILKKYFYPSGELKEIISLDTLGNKDSISTYFNETGATDSTVNFENNKREGIKTSFYSIVTYEDLYKNNLLVTHKEYDTLNNLVLQTPLDIKSISKTVYKFKSGRVYFDQSKMDTIELITKGLPDFNRGMSVTGAVISRIDYNNFKIRRTKKEHDPQPVKIIINIYQNPGSGIPVAFDTLIIESK